MATAQDVLRVASAEVGYCRWDDPEPGTKYGRWYAQVTGSPYFGTSGVPYCAMFVSWVFAHANVSCEGFPRAVAIDRRDGFARMVEPENLQPGDAVGFDWDYDHSGDHVGIVESRNGDQVTICTYEGNTGNGEVKRCDRYTYQCTIGVRPYYDGSSNPAKDAGRLVVDGSCGHNTVSELQIQRGTTVDSTLSGQMHYEDRYRRNVWAVDYENEGSGSQLIRNLQQFLTDTGDYHGTIDGCWGGEFSAGMQRRLKSLGYYTGEIDKDFGHHSVEALQMSLNDGKWS